MLFYLLFNFKTMNTEIPIKEYIWSNKDIKELISKWIKIAVKDNWWVNFNKKQHPWFYDNEPDSVIVLNDFLYFNNTSKVWDKIALGSPEEWIWHKYIWWWTIWIIENFSWNQIFFKKIVRNHIEDMNNKDRAELEGKRKKKRNKVYINYFWLFFWIFVITAFIALIKYIVN